MKKFLFVILMGLSMAACRQHEADAGVAERDTSITISNSFSELFFDSLALEKFIAAHTMHDTLSGKRIAHD